MNLPNIVGIAGNAGAGKDTAAQWFVKRGYAVRRFADPLKQMLNEQFGWTMDDWEDRVWKENDECMQVSEGLSSCMARSFSPRMMAQWLGTDVVRNNFGKDAWVDLFKQRWHDEGQPKIVVPDVRFQNEVDAIHKLGGSVIMLRRSYNLFTVPAHESEETAGLARLDSALLNDGTINDLYNELTRRYA